MPKDKKPKKIKKRKLPPIFETKLKAKKGDIESFCGEDVYVAALEGHLSRLEIVILATKPENFERFARRGRV